MVFHFKTEVLPNHAVFTCTGEYSLDATLKVFRESLRFAEEKALMAVLVNFKGLVGPYPSVLERYEIGTRVSEIHHQLFLPINLVVVGDEPMIDPDRLGEMVATNRGTIGKVFVDLEIAVSWLDNWINERKKC